MRNSITKHKKPMRLLALSLAMILAFAVLAAGCTPKKVDVNDSVKPNETVNTNVTEDFNKLVANGAKPADIIKFLNENVSKATKAEASSIINELEKLQLEYQAELQSKFENTDFQKELFDLYVAKGDINKPDSMKSEDLKALISETLDNGFKVETAEGMFFPVIDYSAIAKFSTNVTDDMKDYIEIMAVESDNAPAKDAAFVIGWNELIERALKQEAFLKNHANSNKLPEVQNLYDKYVVFTIYGLNNTPLFDYETKTMNSEAKRAYTAMDLSGEGSEFKQMLKLYLEVIEKSDYKLTKEVEKYRDRIVNKE